MKGNRKLIWDCVKFLLGWYLVGNAFVDAFCENQTSDDYVIIDD